MIDTLNCWYRVVSKSSLIILLLVTPVTFLAATASLQSGGGRSGKNVSMHYEVNADVIAVRDDVRGLHDRADRVPQELRSFCADAADNIETLAADVKASANAAVRRLAEMVRIG